MVNSSVLCPVVFDRVHRPGDTWRMEACFRRLPKNKQGPNSSHETKRCRTPPPAPKGWGHSSVGRASALQAECRRFESDCLHQTIDPGV